jgi:hypothetical protein
MTTSRPAVLLPRYRTRSASTHRFESQCRRKPYPVPTQPPGRGYPAQGQDQVEPLLGRVEQGRRRQ